MTINTKEELDELILRGDNEALQYYMRIVNGEDEATVLQEYNHRDMSKPVTSSTEVKPDNTLKTEPEPQPTISTSPVQSQAQKQIDDLPWPAEISDSDTDRLLRSTREALVNGSGRDAKFYLQQLVKMKLDNSPAMEISFINNYNKTPAEIRPCGSFDLCRSGVGFILP